MIYLKTLFYAPNEIKYIKLNLMESFKYIDKFIICEFNRTHVGSDKELIFKNFLKDFVEKEKEKIIYIGADISKLTKYSKEDSAIMHENEKIMRGYFSSQIDLKDNDIVISLDADEIIFEQYYKKLLSNLNFFNNIFILQIYQFFYRINYLWENKKFIAPVICRAKCYKHKFPGQWRYEGRLVPYFVGCHFSWCISIEEMMEKLNSYAHTADYKNFADKELLENAIEKKIYPFSPNEDFKIKVLDIYKDNLYYPKSIFNILDQFNNLIGK